MAQKLVSAEVPRRVLYRVEEAVVLLGLSRSQLYELIRSGRLQTVTEGRVRLIPAAAIDAYVSLLKSRLGQIVVATRRNPGDGGLHWEESRQRWFATVYVGNCGR